MKRAGCTAALVWAAWAGGEAGAHAQAPTAAVAQTDAAQTEAQEAAPLPAAGAPLALETVLAASARHFPAILESYAQREAALGRATAAEGAFDLVLSANGRARASGFWSGRFVDTQVSKPLAAFGGEVFGSYRIADGRFPVYEDVYFTNRIGEFKVGAVLSLLRDREFDQRRFGRLDAALTVRNADFELLLAQLAVQHQASVAYQNWLFAGLQLQVYRDLLAIARERQLRLSQQVARGARAEIVLTENQQNVLRREVLVAEAERALAAAATVLSLYLRTPTGAPSLPDPASQPRAAPPRDPEAVAQAIADSQEALAARPDLGVLRTEIERAENEARLGRNELKPKLDFSYEIARDLGDIQEGGPSRSGLDNIVGFRFSTPLERNFAKGKIQQADARRRALEFRLQRQTEQIGAEIEQIRIELVAADRLAILAGQEVEQAQTMQNAEARLFEGGASDFFLLNQREERTADARIRALEAQLRRQIALADLYAATVNLEQLGLAPVRPG
jgi:outer membrane protein TolC